MHGKLKMNSVRAFSPAACQSVFRMPTPEVASAYRPALSLALGLSQAAAHTGWVLQLRSRSAKSSLSTVTQKGGWL